MHQNSFIAVGVRRYEHSAELLVTIGKSGKILNMGQIIEVCP